MSTATKEVLDICERLTDVQQQKLAEFARTLVSNRPPHDDEIERWLARATGASTSGLTTDQIMALTRGEP